MKYQTTSFTNISQEVFEGKYDSEDYSIEAGATRYFPTVLSEHLAKLLSEKIMETKDKEGSNREALFAETKAKILGKEVKTKTSEKPRSFKDEALEHERKFVENTEKEKTETEIKRLEAIKIAKEDV